ncbi:response regulator transcription factor [Myxococcus landrumensis]|uniref:Response regulator transcription factor n=1 Tax=Myxococcus landrumensis TaxID=2813577 RepID=A0ABX7NFC3_9BACT|nr:response regulator transcription factor [Myxococcus landrumus]QSQ17505.1 response regulator transcription factor [Myxococcus landrumus]
MASVPYILLVEDDERLARLVSSFLEGQGFRVRTVANGPDALASLQHEAPDCLVLDILLPGMDGIEVCRRARASYSGWILMLTALDEDIHEVVALDTGADDYVTKPVRPQVLLSRLRALFRRTARDTRKSTQDARWLPSVGLRIDGVLRTVSLAESPVHLTDAEFDLLWLLANRAPEVLSRDDLLSALRGIEHDGLDRSIDMRISKLRRKLGDEQPPHRIIKTVRGRGYFCTPE